MVRLVTAGGVIIDTVVAADGVLGPRTMGGNAVYSAAGANLWLDGVGIVGRVPANYPREHLDRVAAAGVDVRGIRFETDRVSDGEWFFYRPDGSRADHLHGPLDEPLPAEPGERLSPAACRALEARFAARPPSVDDFAGFRRRHPVRLTDLPADYADAQAFHLPANRIPEQIAMLVELAHAGRLVSVDPGANAATYTAAELGTVMTAATAFLPSERELAALAPGLARAAAVDHVAARGPARLVVKLGGEGSLVRADEGSGAVPLPCLGVAVRDPTGAGDAFCGGFLAGLLLTGDTLAAAAMATVSASFAVEAFGPFHLLETPAAAGETRLTEFLGTLEPMLADHVRRHLSALDPA
jgi:ribokinase